MTAIWCELALVDGRPEPSVLIEIDDGRFGAVRCAAQSGGGPPDGAVRLAGFTIPGMANAHSHAFHRALRSRTQVGHGSFWTWRDLMYRAAGRLEPDGYHRLGRAVFAEMVMAGVTSVGEFHYVHHRPDGRPYRDPNEMGHALVAAAASAGVRMTLLDTLYLNGGLDGSGYSQPTGAQRRFTDGSVEAWIERIDALEPTDALRIGGAIHSVRAVDPVAMKAVGRWADGGERPIHAHVSEQVAENEACLANHGMTPTGLLDQAGLLSPRFTAVHATHVDEADIAALATSGATVVMCPTTERDLGDGIGPTAKLASAGVPIALGTDSHAMIDLLEEARALELDERLRSQERGVHSATDLMTMATVDGHRSLGWDDAGSITAGSRADLVTIALDSVRTAGTAATSAVETAVFAATAADVTDVFVDGRHVVADRRHSTVDTAAELDASIGELMEVVES